MNEIEIFENFNKINKIIKKQKKAKRIFKTSISKTKSFLYIFMAGIFFNFCIFFTSFIGLQFYFILSVLGFFIGLLISCIIGITFEYLTNYNIKKYGDGKLIDYYIKEFGYVNKKNIDKVKIKINKIISDEEFTIFNKIFNVKTKAMYEYILKNKGLVDRQKAISDFNKLDQNYFLTIKYIVENFDIKDLEKINGEKAKKSIKIFNIYQQLELSTIINKRINGNEYKKQAIDHNLGISDKIKIKCKNIIDI